jgi:type IV pilus assembly protein PilC
MVATVAYAFLAELNPTERSNVLWELAELYDDRADRLLKWLELTYEPLLVLFLGCFIGFTIIALFLPLVSLISNLS